MGANNRRVLSRIFHSFTVKLFSVAVVLLSVPLLLYWQFAQTEQRQQKLLSNAADQTNQVIAAALVPRFAAFSHEPAEALKDAMTRVAAENIKIKVLMRLAGSGPDSFTYVAASPALSEDNLKRERVQLVQSGVFHRLAPTCDGTTSLDLPFVSPSGEQEILTAMTPVHVAGDCWVVITSESAANLTTFPVSLSFWKAPTMRAAAIYLLSALLLLWLFAHIWINMRRFRKAARRIRLGEGGPVSFSSINTITEFHGVAEDFDALVDALIASQRRIREAAEENSHALKAPLAVISQAVEPIKRGVAHADSAAMRAAQLIERSVARLDAMVSAHRDLEMAEADLVFPARGKLDLPELLRSMLPAFEDALAAQNKYLIVHMEEGSVAMASDDLMEPVIENLLENAASVTRSGGAIELNVTREPGLVRLRVMDRGPGVLPHRLPRIFERGTTFREPSQASSSAHCYQEPGRHQGLGLWIVQRNVEAAGGSVMAINREGGGLEVIVRLPSSA